MTKQVKAKQDMRHGARLRVMLGTRRLALLRHEDIQARQEVCRVPAPVQLRHRPLQPPEPHRKGSVWKRSSPSG